MKDRGIGGQGLAAFVVAFATAASVTSAAGAAPLDPALNRLLLHSECQSGGVFQSAETARQALASEHPATGANGLCNEDSGAFKRLVSEWGFALAPNSMYPATSTGYGGFEFALQASYTAIDSDADYWVNGSQGERDPSSGAAPTFGSAPGVLSMYGLNIRKSFGLGFEALANLSFVPDSSIINGGLDVRLSLLEGFRTGVLGALPDIGLGAGVRTMTGTDQLQLTTVAAEARMSKSLTIASRGRITPWIGYQFLWMFGRSGVIDLTPGTDPIGFCGFAGPDHPRSGEAGQGVYEGTPICNGGSALDFNNNAVFDDADLERQRLVVGISYQHEFVMGGVQFLTDLMAPAEAQTSTEDAEILDGVPRQWQLAIDLGVQF